MKHSYLGITHQKLHSNVPESLAGCTLAAHEEAAQHCEGGAVYQTIPVEKDTGVVRQSTVRPGSVHCLVHYSLGKRAMLARDSL